MRETVRRKSTAAGRYLPTPNLTTPRGGAHSGGREQRQGAEWGLCGERTVKIRLFRAFLGRNRGPAVFPTLEQTAFPASLLHLRRKDLYDSVPAKNQNFEVCL
jgi:hypothetical protein